ncbi:MAG: hypothetical protein H7X97_11355 [Opitutaceae bacterium]|nr:hypothetical protein [Verrucomicrobiales bacterium]
MLRFFQRTFVAVLLMTGAGSAFGFSLLGPFAPWQVPRLGYAVGGDIGGPMNQTEEYRWNIRTITYGFDRTFIDYFGLKGVEEVNKAIAILNNLPAASKMSTTLSEFPLDTRRFNSQAAALKLLDLKSIALTLLIEEMGLADPERFTWCLRTHVDFPGPIHQYAVIMRNFDPVTWAPSKYVNGTLYTYIVVQSVYGPDLSDALETTVDPLAPLGTAVASFSIGLGRFYTGLTRDDVGGLRYMLRKSNRNYENILPDMLPAAGGPWTPVGGTNNQGTNLLVNVALREGVDKVVFKQMRNEFGIGLLIPQTNKYTDEFFVSNGRGGGRLAKQKTQRGLVLPDILFTADDISTPGPYPAVAARVDTGNWQDNSGANTQGGLGLNAGPGVIQPPIVITFNNVGDFNFNMVPGFVDEATPLVSGWVWGSFDGTTNAPFVYSRDRRSLEDLENAIFLEDN